MDRLWAPWRLSYVRNDDCRTPSDDFIRDADLSDRDRENLVVCRSELSIVILNRFPYSNGHVLIAPRRPVPSLEDMTDDELLDCQKTVIRMMQAMRTFLNPDGFNVGLNLGKASGAGLPCHLHWHIVPRWNGDTNFMTLMCDTRVISQSLDEFWLAIRKSLGLEAE
jgi:ATP adenylyltransferase